MPYNLLDGYKFHVLARTGLAASTPTLASGELGYTTDTKTFLIGDDTASPPRSITTKSTGAFDFSIADSVKFASVLMTDGGKVDGLDLSTALINGGGVISVKPDGTLASRLIVSGNDSLVIVNASGNDGNIDIRISPALFATYLQTVAHDDSLTGFGTVGSPLSVTQATEVLRAGLEIATVVEALAGVLHTHAITPLTLKNYVDAAIAALPSATNPFPANAAGFLNNNGAGGLSWVHLATVIGEYNARTFGGPANSYTATFAPLKINGFTAGDIIYGTMNATNTTTIVTIQNTTTGAVYPVTLGDGVNPPPIGSLIIGHTIVFQFDGTSIRALTDLTAGRVVGGATSGFSGLILASRWKRSNALIETFNIASYSFNQTTKRATVIFSSPLPHANYIVQWQPVPRIFGQSTTFSYNGGGGETNDSYQYSDTTYYIVADYPQDALVPKPVSNVTDNVNTFFKTTTSFAFQAASWRSSSNTYNPNPNVGGLNGDSLIDNGFFNIIG